MIQIDPAPDGWWQAVLFIDWPTYTCRIEWWPIVAFEVGSEYEDEDQDDDLVGEPVLPRNAPSCGTISVSREAIMDPFGAHLWMDRVFASTGEWFIERMRPRGAYRLVSETFMPHKFDPAPFRPRKKSAARKSAMVRAIRASR